MLKRVKIQGYKSLKDVEVQLQPLTVLFGPNASGKSNFLDALQLLSRIATERTLNNAFSPPYRGTLLESFTFGPNGVTDLLLQEKSFFGIEVDVELSQRTIDIANRKTQIRRKMRNGKIVDDAEQEISTVVSPPIERRNLRYFIKIEVTPKAGTLVVAEEYLGLLNDEGEIVAGPPILERNYGFLRLGDTSEEFFETLEYSALSVPDFFYPLHSYEYLTALQEELNSWFFFYLEPRERMRIPTPVKEVHHIGLMGEEIAAFLNTLHTFNPAQFGAVEKALKLVIPSITGINVGVNSLGEVELNLLEGKTPISARVVSEGTLRVLGLLALSGARESPSLIGFEEPENGINPRRLDLIASLLQTRAWSDTQVLVTTHSALLLDLIPLDSLYVCRKHKGHTTIEPITIQKKYNLRKALDDEDEITVSERMFRGDFDA